MRFVGVARSHRLLRGASRRLPSPRRTLESLAWLAAAVTIALGAAGVAAAIDHEPGTAARPELTWAGDTAATRELDTAERELAAIAADVDALGLQARGALAALAARDFDVLTRATDDGARLARAVRQASDALRNRLLAMPGLGADADLRLSRPTRERQIRLLDGVAATEPLGLSWARLRAGSDAAVALASNLDAHDERITAAIEAGRRRDFETAITRIEAASERLAQSRALRDRLASTTDVATLDEWLRRNGEYDEALRELYELSARTPERVTPELRDAIAREQAARDALPESTNGLSIIMADIARGGLNQAVITIEEARGRLGTALAEPEPEPEPPPQP